MYSTHHFINEAPQRATALVERVACYSGLHILHILHIILHIILHMYKKVSRLLAFLSQSTL